MLTWGDVIWVEVWRCVKRCGVVRGSHVAYFDETTARLAGRTWWEWVFAIGAGVLHVIRPSRGQGSAAESSRNGALKRMQPSEP